MHRVAVIGATGFAGAELMRRLLLHPELELVQAGAIDHVGEPVSATNPHLEGLSELRFERLGPGDIRADVDVVLLGLPTTASWEWVAALRAARPELRLVDLSGGFRLRDAAAYPRSYGAEHPHPGWLGEFVYGLPELNRAALAGARRVASPGCFATCIQLGLLPLARAGLLRPGCDVHTVAITGSSGSGVAPSAGTHHPTRAVNLKSYRPLSHAHEPEVEEGLAAAGAPDVRLRFVPVSAPLVRGILATSQLELPAAVSTAQLDEAWQLCFERDRFVRRPRGRLPEVVAIAGGNYAEVGFELGERRGDTRTVVCFSALDNLVKGGAGQAIQNLNLMLGLDEALALEDPGGYP